MKKSKLMQRSALLLLGALIIIQFFRIDKQNPETKEGADFLVINDTPVAISSILKNACYDCHSHETVYPWYTNVAPLSFWINGHINNARGHLNFSEWADLDLDKRRYKLEECTEMVEKKWMPIGAYKLLHEEARITDQERDQLIAYFESLRQIGSK